MLHVECRLLSVRLESAEIYFFGCNKYTVDKFVHILKSRDEDECGFFQQDGVSRRTAIKSVVAIRNTLGTQKLIVSCGLLVHWIQRHVTYLWRSFKDIVY